MANHPIVHVEFTAADPAAAAKFYAEAFGWQLQHDAEFDYWMFSAAGGPGGGFVGVGQGDSGYYEKGKPLVYVGSDDLEADLARIESLGGKTVQPPMEIPGSGWLAVFSDPAGTLVGLYKYLTPGG